MSIVVSFLAILVAVFLEAIFSPIPLTLLSIIFFGVFQKKEWVFIIALVGGMVLDSLTFRPLGISSLFFVTVLGLIFLYGRKFETNHFLFIFFATTISSVIYEVIFSPLNIFVSTFFIGLLCGLLFFIFLLLRKKFTSTSQ